MASTEQAEKAALVTGGSRGIGYELAKLCAQDGYDVVLVARQLSKDLARPESAREIHDEVEGTDLRVDILVNNAAAGSCLVVSTRRISKIVTTKSR